MGLHFAARRAMSMGCESILFLEGSSFNIRDIIVFIKYYLECHTLLQCSKSANMDYKNTSVYWASYIRELFCQYVSTIYDYTEFEGEVELDESLFGRKVKYHRGNPSGLRIWIFGIVERSTNRIVLYPVDDRSANTLVPLIQKHVKPGSRIFSDSWAAYNTLNDIGYEHFSVVHKTSFKQKYVSTQTGEEVYCCTNRIEVHGRSQRTILGQ
ncbi:unnamed protein product [Mytilus edulis]|uniref:ISXO2-like transposase domain-containing protein n=1 Tax=Mytilus edulis TaxID=6550 RepID=A0A8S3QAT1_MYTED|nr:unnamed protein product [Mytilus edulis]